MSDINRPRLRATLKRDEGCNLKRHDVQGIDHIGFGINLEEELSDAVMSYLGVEDEDDIEVITQEQADWLLDNYIDNVAIPDCKKIFDNWDDLSGLRKEVLINLAFNLGAPRLRKFRKMVTAVKTSDWEEAAAQMLNSKAARQTGDRYLRLANAFKNDDEKHLQLGKSFGAPDEEDTGYEDIDTAELIADLEDLVAELKRRL